MCYGGHEDVTYKCCQWQPGGGSASPNVPGVVIGCPAGTGGGTLKAGPQGSGDLGFKIWGIGESYLSAVRFCWQMGPVVKLPVICRERVLELGVGRGLNLRSILCLVKQLSPPELTVIPQHTDCALHSLNAGEPLPTDWATRESETPQLPEVGAVIGLRCPMCHCSAVEMGFQNPQECTDVGRREKTKKGVREC